MSAQMQKLSQKKICTTKLKGISARRRLLVRQVIAIVIPVRNINTQ